MTGAKIVVLYPMPRDVEAFERAYVNDHVPMVTPRDFPGLTKFVATKVAATPTGAPPPFHRVAELYFPSMTVLRNAVGAETAQQAVAHAISISTGGSPVV